MNLSPRWRALIPSGTTLGLLLVLGIFTLLLGLRGELGSFFSRSNLQNLLKQSTVPVLVALGLLLIMISGGIDLSVGSVLALVTVVTVLAYNAVLRDSGSRDLASAAGIAAGIAAGGAAGLVNGLVITTLRVSPFVTTLGMYSVARGMAHWLTDKTMIPLDGRTPNWMRLYERQDFYNPGIWSALLLAVLVWLLLRQTVLGRHCFAIGSNEATARLCGVPVAWRKIVIYTLAGLLTGWAGVVYFARTGAGDPNGHEQLTLEVIAAVVIGGASLNGGRGTVLGTLLGVFLLTALGSVLSFLRLSVDFKLMVIGAVVVLNTALANWQKRE